MPVIKAARAPACEQMARKANAYGEGGGAAHVILDTLLAAQCAREPGSTVAA